MRCVVQRVARASVTVEGQKIAAIGAGYLVLVGVEEGDTEADMIYCADKIAGLRIFEDENGKMNLSVADVDGEVLLVSQFTLLGDARHGRRPSFSAAARPEVADPLCQAMRQRLMDKGLPVQTGQFQAHMHVELLNDGPVTILLDSRKGF
ncbi:MAG TPA: D-tyrosyl-tRNA(Tyr) deacylase [Candidatus Alectryocaccomicrobium excrementavium]|uniref:D-aminoacyl-tRNA deacylase n=1 Tax=Candidatus Alectryocaccomicrobium excrementavium TaxID=2840668 RepID=A0A9D1K661_9FIRM|nr:D-tyrosyl-tRNA(Tyr) deacylase [Candidatus Alectryocaccomicrobium excrementavium]